MTKASVKKGEIVQARGQYSPVATRGAIIYFIINELAVIDPMY